MGYRSDVVLAFDKEAKTALLLANKSLPTPGNNIDVEDNEYFELDEGVTAYKFIDVKWYPDYPLIMKFDELTRFLEDSDLSDHYCFARVGEEVGDFEDAGGLNNLMPGEFYEFCQHIDIHF